MRRTHMYLAAGAAVVAMTAGTVAAHSGVSSAAPGYLAHRGIEHLQTPVTLPANVWTNTPLQVTLPVAGTYTLDADVRGRIEGTPPVNSWITARLWNVTTATVVPGSERIISQIVDRNAGDAFIDPNQTAPISELIDVSQPATILVQARRIDAQGRATIAQIYSDYNGYTSLRYQEVFP